MSAAVFAARGTGLIIVVGSVLFAIPAAGQGEEQQQETAETAETAESE